MEKKKEESKKIGILSLGLNYLKKVIRLKKKSNELKEVNKPKKNIKKKVEVMKKKKFSEKKNLTKNKPFIKEKSVSLNKPVIQKKSLIQKKIILKNNSLVKEEPIPKNNLIANEEPIIKEKLIIKKKLTIKKNPIIKKKLTIQNKPILEQQGGLKPPYKKEIEKQREPINNILNKVKHKKKKMIKEYIKTGIEGFDQLFENGIPKGSSVLVAGGAGSGKTILCLQTLIHHASQGKKCFYMSFEESEERLIMHMKDFGWDPEKLIKSGNLVIKRFSPFDVTRSVEAMLAKEKGELLIDIDPIVLPENFEPDFLALDSLTAVASAFTGKEDSYRIYIEQLFRFFEKLKTTSFLITETEQMPTIFSTTGVEEFLADGVVVLYAIKRGDIRESAIEVLKMRGEKHQKKIVAVQVTDNGLEVYPEQEVYGEIK